jgi:hypothetical protein
MIHFLKALFKDIIDQAWTLLGMIVAWLVLEGSARDTVGMLIWITLGIWVITFPLRYEKPEADEEELPRDGDGDGYIFDGTPAERKDPRAN